jgi:hypothetical protein
MRFSHGYRYSTSASEVQILDSISQYDVLYDIEPDVGYDVVDFETGIFIKSNSFCLCHKIG